jgi:hypothetical protein
MAFGEDDYDKVYNDEKKVKKKLQKMNYHHQMDK